MSDSLTKVYHQLYISDYETAQNISKLRETGITHVVRCLVDVDEEQCHDGITYLNIEIQDVEQANLLQHLPSTCNFIQEALTRNQSVLVHCQAGVSRSAAVVIAYIMKMEQLSYEQALIYVQKTRASVLPNTGFRDQCNLFAEMDYTINEEHAQYRRFIMQQTRNGNMNTTNTTSITSTDNTTSPPQSLSIRCRKCRCPLLTDEHMITHTAGSGQSAFSPHRRNQSYGHYTPTQCSSYFIEPMEWIDGIMDGDNEGKIQCPKCLAKLGQYSWSGTQCSCGAWITPAVALHRNRVDAIQLK
ncbi:dual specificity phosphatase 12 [Syncephalis plumigaleata]|nr:dual specificity phosphatase 12 [Syncephalis plumigaleata]